MRRQLTLGVMTPLLSRLHYRVGNRGVAKQKDGRIWSGAPRILDETTRRYINHLQTKSRRQKGGSLRNYKRRTRRKSRQKRRHA